MSQYFVCCRDLLVLEMYWKLPAKSFENFAMGLLWLKLSWASSGLWKFPSLKFRTGIIRNTSGNSEGPPRICQTKWYSSGSGINNRNDPNKKVHLLETFCPERVRELISCRAGANEIFRYYLHLRISGDIMASNDPAMTQRCTYQHQHRQGHFSS